MSNTARTGSCNGSGLGSIIGGIVLLWLFSGLLEELKEGGSSQPNPAPRPLPPRTDNNSRNVRRPLRMNEYGECE